MIDFKLPYERNSADSFLSRFLPDDLSLRLEEKIKLNFKPQFIRKVNKLGEVPSLQSLHVFEVTHDSENDPRVGLSRDAFRILANFGIRKALFFFVSEKSPNYRLSLVTLDLKWEVGKKIEQEYSNPRRYSFFLGPDAKVRTPKSFLQEKGQVEDVADLISRFDVEIVTKEFFANYRKLFEKLTDYLEKDHIFRKFVETKGIDIATFAKKLLGQIVFCYFLQRKGWLGASKGKRVNEGDKDFMRTLFNRCTAGKHFYNDYLEHLFYDSLNNRSTSAADFYRPYFQCQIPFLNGGLFEPLEGYDWRKAFLHIPDKLFSNADKTGILDVFDLYNFTVYEDDPTDREVAVDPEMLGKVFENLLEENLRKGKGTYYTPREIVHYMCRESLVNYLVIETKVEERKIRNLVTFKDVTPEQIVEGINNEEARHRNADKGPAYWVEQEGALIEKALSNIRVCDPACGSGAFLVGMLNEIVSVRRLLNFDKSEHQLKKESIENCIYGVDIDPGAVEIAKLRLWLSLVVDHELEEIEPLPNLDYKIMCGNSLLEELVVGDESIELVDPRLLEKNKPKQKISDRVMQLDLFYQDAEKYLEMLAKLHVQYFHETNAESKKSLRRRIEKIELDFIQASINKRVEDIETGIKNLNMQKQEDRKKNTELLEKKLEYLAIPNNIRKSRVRPYFLWHLNFFEVFQEKNGFDIVIANPPYVGEKGNEKIFHEILKAALGKRFYTRWMDYFYYFFHLGLDLGNTNAFIAFITTNYYLTATGAIKLRADIKTRSSVKKLINFNELRIFESAKGQHNMITILQKKKDEEVVAKNCFTNLRGDCSSQILINILSEQDLETQYYDVSQLDLFEGQDFQMRLAGQGKTSLTSIDSVLNKMKQQPYRLGNVCNIIMGLVSRADKVSAEHFKKDPNLSAKKGEGIFVITNSELNDLKLSQKDKDKYVRPFYKNSDIKKYYCRQKNKLWLFYLKDEGKPIELSKRMKHHFERYKNLLIKLKQNFLKNKIASGFVKRWLKNGNYFVLFNPKKAEYFTQPKIIAPYRSRKNAFSYNEIAWFASQDVCYIWTKSNEFHMKYLLAILNSKLCFIWLYFKGKRKGEILELYQKPISNIPVARLPIAEQKAFVDLVNKILFITESDDYSGNLLKQNKVNGYERQIDQMVYKLYGLTEEEIKIVESATK